MAPKKNTSKKGQSSAVTQTPSGKAKQEISDESSNLETASITSSKSDLRSLADEGLGLEGEDQPQTDQLEERLREAIDLTSQKSQQGRVSAFKLLSKAFSTKYIPHFVMDRRMTLQDCAERGLKKGRGAEQEEAAKLASLLCFQMGPTADTEALYKDMKSLLLAIINDASANLGVREQSCLTLGILCFMAGQDMEEVTSIMKSFEGVFRRGKAVVAASPEMAALHAAALGSWSLLCTLLPARKVHTLAATHISWLVPLLESPDVDLRITAGEAIALIYEGARELDEDFTLVKDEEEEVLESQNDPESELCEMLKNLATDSQKFRAKKDRRQQRSSFRDVLKAVEEGEAPEVTIRFGTETLELASWSRKKQYDSVCQVLGPGINLHLAENDFVREVFELGPPLLVGLPITKVSKTERHAINEANFKARSVARMKHRDKRSAVF